MIEQEPADVMGIYYALRDDGTYEYRCRGTGKKYISFYREWVPKSSYRCIGVDFPWDYFVFDNPADHDRLLVDFKEDVFKSEDSL